MAVIVVSQNVIDLLITIILEQIIAAREGIIMNTIIAIVQTVVMMQIEERNNFRNPKNLNLILVLAAVNIRLLNATNRTLKNQLILRR